jgi:hypothetical protein
MARGQFELKLTSEEKAALEKLVRCGLRTNALDVDEREALKRINMALTEWSD